MVEMKNFLDRAGDEVWCRSWWFASDGWEGLIIRKVLAMSRWGWWFVRWWRTQSGMKNWSEGCGEERCSGRAGVRRTDALTCDSFFGLQQNWSAVVLVTTLSSSCSYFLLVVLIYSLSEGDCGVGGWLTVFVLQKRVWCSRLLNLKFGLHLELGVWIVRILPTLDYDWRVMFCIYI